MTNKITLPTSIQEDLSLLFSKYSVKTTSLRVVINLIHDNPKTYPNLFIWLFDTKGYQANQLKFLMVFSGHQYEYMEQRYKYIFGDYTITKNRNGWECNATPTELNCQWLFTRDEIADSPFGLFKLVEIPYNDEKENIN